MADAEKELGNTQFKAGNYDQAITHFTNAINIAATHVLYSNRSACYCGLRKYDDALNDVRSRGRHRAIYSAHLVYTRYLPIRRDSSPLLTA